MPTDIGREVDRIANMWQVRNRQMEKWYRLIRLENDLHQDGMESVISPDPRTSYDMAVWLLKPRTWRVRFDSTGMSDDEIRQVGGLEQRVEKEFVWQHRVGRTRMLGPVIDQAVRLFVATGWLAISALPGDRHWVLNTYHPATVYPDYDNDGRLVAVARRYNLPQARARAYTAASGWATSGMQSKSIVVKSLWQESPFGILHGVEIDGKEAMPLQPIPGLHRIPMYVLPGGGLPDDGNMHWRWAEDVGQSIVAGILDLQKNINKTLTYMQQILRDTSNPVTVTNTQGGQSPVTPENRFKRGQVYDLGMNESIWSLGNPPLPPDVRLHIMDMHSMAQRSLFPDVSFGNFNQAVSTFLMTQSIAGTQKILSPFHEGLKAALGEVVTDNIETARFNGRTDVLGYPLVGVPEELVAAYDYDIVVPGDFVNRINSARIANPEFRLSQQTIMETLMPEVRNYGEEQGRLSVEDANRSEQFQLANQVLQARQAALEAAAFGDIEAERMYVQVAEGLKAQLQGQPPDGVGAETMEQALRRLNRGPAR